MVTALRVRRAFRFKLWVSLILVLGIVLFGGIGPLIYPVDPTAATGRSNQPPSKHHPLGTDAGGKDVLAQVMHGTRTSLLIGFVAATISLATGLIIGVIAGYRRGIIDEMLMSMTNIILALPVILLMMLLAVFVPVRSSYTVAILIGLTSWPWVARAVRAQIMSLKERQFVYLGKMAGWSGMKIALFDLVPNMLAYIFMAFVLLMSGAVLAEAGLSMIGVGLTKGTSLGLILFWAQMFEAVRRGMFWWFVPPGAVLVTLATAMLLLSTALDEFFNPRLKGK